MLAYLLHYYFGIYGGDMESGPLVGRIALNGIEVGFFLVGNKNNNFIFMDVKSRISML